MWQRIQIYIILYFASIIFLWSPFHNINFMLLYSNSIQVRVYAASVVEWKVNAPVKNLKKSWFLTTLFWRSLLTGCRRLQLRKETRQRWGWGDWLKRDRYIDTMYRLIKKWTKNHFITFSYLIVEGRVAYIEWGS